MTTVGILPLKCFDMVSGEDWLEECSPMWVHWSNKIMRFTYQGKRIELYGVKQQVISVLLFLLTICKGRLQKKLFIFVCS